MDNFLFVKILETRDELGSDFLNSIDHKRPPLLLEIDLHIFAVHELHQDMEFVILGNFVVLPHKILVFNYIWVDQIPSNCKFCKHLLHCLFGELGVVVNLPHLVHEFASYPFDFALVYVRLGAPSEILHLLDFKLLSFFLEWSSYDLDVFF